MTHGVGYVTTIQAFNEWRGIAVQYHVMNYMRWYYSNITAQLAQILLHYLRWSSKVYIGQIYQHADCPRPMIQYYLFFFVHVVAVVNSAVYASYYSKLIESLWANLLVSEPILMLKLVIEWNKQICNVQTLDLYKNGRENATWLIILQSNFMRKWFQRPGKAKLSVQSFNSSQYFLYQLHNTKL